MKRIGDVMYREPTAAEWESTSHVLELAEAWQRGELSLASVRAQSSGIDRFRAIRFAPLGSDGKRALQAMLDALCDTDGATQTMNHGRQFLYVARKDKGGDGAIEKRNWRGEWVTVYPLFWMYDEPYYPPVDVEPGDARRERETAMQATYRQYREKKKGRVVEFRRA